PDAAPRLDPRVRWDDRRGVPIGIKGLAIIRAPARSRMRGRSDGSRPRPAPRDASGVRPVAYKLFDMSLFALGLNHTTAPLDVRERVAFAPEALGDAL